MTRPRAAAHGLRTRPLFRRAPRNRDAGAAPPTRLPPAHPRRTRNATMQCAGATQRAAVSFHARLLLHEASSSEAALEPDVQRQAACLLLASKVREEPLRLRDMVNSVHHLRGEGVLSDSRRYWEQKEALVREEQLLLRALRQADMWPGPGHQSAGCPCTHDLKKSECFH